MMLDSALIDFLQDFVGLEEAVDVFVSVCWLAPLLSRHYDNYKDMCSCMSVIESRRMLTVTLYKSAVANATDMLGWLQRDSSTKKKGHGFHLRNRSEWSVEEVHAFMEDAPAMKVLLQAVGVNLSKLTWHMRSRAVDLLLMWMNFLVHSRYKVTHW